MTLKKRNSFYDKHRRATVASCFASTEEFDHLVDIILDFSGSLVESLEKRCINCKKVIKFDIPYKEAKEQRKCNLVNYVFKTEKSLKENSLNAEISLV